MTKPLNTSLYVHGLIRLCESYNVPAFIVHKGYEHAGSILIKQHSSDNQAKLFQRRYDMDGKLEWYQKEDIFEVETQADTIVKQSVQSDPDIWVIEIEDRRGQLPPMTDKSFWPQSE